nr:hypothetical protein [Gemmata palustris]
MIRPIFVAFKLRISVCFAAYSVVSRRLNVSAACSGFRYALSVGAQFIRTGAVKHALVIGARRSRIIDFTGPEARGTMVRSGRGTRTSGESCWEMKSGPFYALERPSKNYMRWRNACSIWRRDI